MSNRRNIQFTYTPHNKATILDCSFVVDSANANGLGIRSLKASGRIQNVYMQTSATPATGNPLVNTASAGIIVVDLQDNYNRYLGGFDGAVSPVTGSALTTGLTIGRPYVLVSLGASTAAQLQTAGIPANRTPAVGLPFIAAATSVAGGATVKAVATSTIVKLEVIGDTNLDNSNGAYTLGNSTGMRIIIQCLGATDASTTTLISKAPADETVIGLVFYMNDSAQGV